MASFSFSGCSFSFGIIQVSEGIILGVAGFILIMLVYYFYSKKSVLIRSSGGTISHEIGGIKEADINRFIYLVGSNK